MIPPDPVRLRFQSLVALGLAASGVARRVGLAAASEVWGGDEPREHAAWYVWLRDHPGAWQIELARAEPLAAVGGALLARFTVRRYPGPGTAELASFSVEERRVADEAFDDTGTPRIELASSIPASMFTVGTVEWALHEESGASAFVLAGLDRLRTRREDGEVVREVPGWDLTAPIFSLVAGLYAQVERRAASRLVVASQPGFELVASPDGPPDPRDAADAVQGEAALLFDSPRDPGAGGRVLDALRDRDAPVLADVAFAPGVHPPRAVDADPRLSLRVSHAWFGGEAHAADGIACAC